MDVAQSSIHRTNSKLFREYIGAKFCNVEFSDVPINPNVEFHFILSFAIDYTSDNSSHHPTNGKFNIFWDFYNLSPSKVLSIKNSHPNVKVALSIGGDTVGDSHAYFNPSSVDSWVSNAVSSLKHIIEEYNLDGIDINYEHFSSDPDTFARCIGQLITTLKSNGDISFASIAPFDNAKVQKYYLALWRSYSHVIDYVNFQFYAYGRETTVSQFIKYFETQSSNYNGGKILTSFISDGSGGLSPENGFFTACNQLKSSQRLHGIFVWSADDSKANGFVHEKRSQELLSTPLSNPKLFREYIGAKFCNVRFSDVPINPNVEFHFILSFAIDYSSGSSHNPTNGKFNIFWDSNNLSPSKVVSIKNNHSNVKVALSLGGDTVGDDHAYFKPSSVDSWVKNAVSSLRRIIKEYNLDGIDIDYQHFSSDPDTFAECIGQLITVLKRNGDISFASIAPYDDAKVQRYYLALWKSYSYAIDYVNFQFYAYDQATTVSQFIKYFETQSSNYNGGKVLTSFISDGSGGLSPKNGFFTACNKLKSSQQLHGIFVWSADDSKANGFIHEKKSQELLSTPN